MKKTKAPKNPRLKFSHLVRPCVVLQVAGEPRHLLTCVRRNHLVFFSPGGRAGVFYIVLYGRHRHDTRRQSLLFLLVAHLKACRRARGH